MKRKKMTGSPSLADASSAVRGSSRRHPSFMSNSSFSEELSRAEQDDAGENQKIQSLCNTCKGLQEYNNNLQNYNSRLQEELGGLRGHYTSLQEQLTSSRAVQDEAVKQKEALANEVGFLRGDLQKMRDDRDKQSLQVQALTAKVMSYKECTGKAIVELEDIYIKIKHLEETCLSQSEQIKRLQQQLAERLEESKGNIRVFCRVRPLLSDDTVSAETKVISFPTSMEAQGRGINLIQNGQKQSFTFDKVFMPEASQEDVFVEISQLVQSALDGYKVCIFAYGQTGSGKTYTMMGKTDSDNQKGLIPRSLEQVFETRQSLQNQGWNYRMQVSMLEIYNETIRDLLSPSNSSCFDASRPDNVGKQYAIKHDVNGNTHVSDLTIVDVHCYSQVSKLFGLAAESRSVGKTQMNQQSSRSHFVFTLRISGVNESTEQQVQGVLNLIDLAGSERLSKSGSTGDRLKETQAINKSLSSLSDVIFALVKKEQHVPFRNSKLTYLLQPCLGGNSKTLMLVNVSPDHPFVGESLCSLQFAARVNACEIGIPRR